LVAGLGQLPLSPNSVVSQSLWCFAATHSSKASAYKLVAKFWVLPVAREL
jgi:hypothetical protein